MFSHLKTLITGGTFTQINTTNTKDGFELLQQAVAHGAFHNSGERFDPPKCHENTRIAVLQRVMDWILRSDPETREAVIMWLYGPAGAGKSAIAQTIAEMLEAANHTVSSFFFLRHDPMRGSAKALVPTLVYQMMLAFPPTFREVVVQSIERDPLIFTKSLKAQFTTLVLAPLEQLFLSGFSSNLPHVIIIDGLDECDRRMQANIINVACKMQHRNRFIPLLFLIASRPEVDITVALDNILSTSLTRLALDDTYLPDKDIRLFLNNKFAATKKTHRLRSYIPEWWPAEEAIETLVRKSSGQFIYASTVAKFVTDSRGKPHDRLDIVLGLRPVGKESPFAELDALYTHILSDVDNLEAVLDVVGLTILRPCTPGLNFKFRYNAGDVADNTCEHLETLMGLDPGDMSILLQDLTSLVVLIDDQTIVKILHASLEDFLFDQSRSRELHINLGEMHRKCATFVFKAIKNKLSCLSTEVADIDCSLAFSSSHNFIPILLRIFYHAPLAHPMSSLSCNILEFTFQKLLSFLQCVTVRHGTPAARDPHLIGAYLGYLEPLTWDDVKGFRQDQLKAFDQYLESHLATYYMHDDLLLLVAAFSELENVQHSHPKHPYLSSGPICTSRFTETVELERLQLQPMIYYNTYGGPLSSDEPMHAYREEFIRYIRAPDRSRHLYLSSLVYSRTALIALKRVSNGCIWSSIPHRSLSPHDRRTRRNLPTKWRRKSRKRNNYIQRKMQEVFMSAHNTQDKFLDQVQWWTEAREIQTNRRMSAIFHIAAFLLPYLLPKSHNSDELTQLARNVKFGKRAKEYPLEVKAAKRAIKKYLARVDRTVEESRLV